MLYTITNLTDPTPQVRYGVTVNSRSACQPCHYPIEPSAQALLAVKDDLTEGTYAVSWATESGEIHMRLYDWWPGFGQGDRYELAECVV